MTTQLKFSVLRRFKILRSNFTFYIVYFFVIYYRLSNIVNKKTRISFLKRHEEFYQKHHHAEGKSVYFAGGAESVIYKCSSDDELSFQGGFILIIQGSGRAENTPSDVMSSSPGIFLNLHLNYHLSRTEILELLALVL